MESSESNVLARLYGVRQTHQTFMRETVEMIVKALEDETEAVEVREVERRDALLIEVRVAEADMGKLIGRQGRTVRALRLLLHAASVKQNRRYILEIVE